MKEFLAAALFVCVGTGMVSAEPPETYSRETASKRSSVIDAIKQISQEWGDAAVAGDVDKLNQILADDWKAIAMSGNLVTKESELANLKSGKDKLVSFEVGPMDVQVMGNVAVVHGSVVEKRIYDGKDASGQFLWMDLLEKRGNRWVVVRSAGARVK